MKESAYKKAGVDIEAGADLVERIKPHVSKTSRAGVMSGLGGFGAFFDLKATGYDDPVLVSSTDGVGTKVRIAIDTGNHDTIGVDVVAMCVNDIIVQGAEPLFFLDYFATGKLENDVAETVIAGVAEGCHRAGCALIGGETAEMPGMYATGDYDLAGFSVGAVEREQIIDGSDVSDGDVIIGLASDGVHSNGFSLVRKLVETSQEYDYADEAPFSPGQTIGEGLLTPTRIYVKPLLQVLKEKGAVIKAMAHITGGGLSENIPRVLSDDLCAVIDAAKWPLPPVFAWLSALGNLEFSDMASTFNCGIGMAVICAESSAPEITRILQDQSETVFEIGRITKRENGQAICIENMEAAWKAKS